MTGDIDPVFGSMPGVSGMCLARRFDGGGEVTVLRGDNLNAVEDAADARDAGPVADVAVVEHDVIAGGIPADVLRGGVVAVGHAGHRQGWVKAAGLLDVVEVAEVQR